MAGVALDGLDQVGNQVMAALQLHVDLRPRVFHLVAPSDELVVHPDRVDDEQNHSGNHDDCDYDHHDTPSLRREGLPRVNLRLSRSDSK